MDTSLFGTAPSAVAAAAVDDAENLFGPPAPPAQEFEDLFGAPPAAGDDVDATNLFGPPARRLQDDATHLVVLQHGLHGSPADYQTFEFILKDVFRDVTGLYIVAAESNAKDTHDGIDVGGTRLADEVEALAASCPKLEKLSLVGHSLGGLYVRYCIGVLYARQFFDRIIPMNMISLASPHLGIRVPFTSRGAINAIANTLSSKLFDRTGAQFVLQDQASPETLSLANHYLGAPVAAVAAKVDIQLPAPNAGFALLPCRLEDRLLSLFISESDEPIFVFDLSAFTAVLFVPEAAPVDAESEAAQYLFDDEPPLDTVLQLRGPYHGDSVTLELRVATSSDWALVHAIVLSFGSVRCVRYSGDKNAVRATPVPPSAPPPLLQCLAQGAFLWGLSRFRRRALYSNVFFDIQVPFACGSVRGFNPYQNNATSCSTSPFYPHITLHSLANAPFCRDTLPAQKWTDLDVYPVFSASPAPKGRFHGWGNYGQFLFQANKAAPVSPSTSATASGTGSPQSNAAYTGTPDFVAQMLTVNIIGAFAGHTVTVVSKGKVDASRRAIENNQVLVDSPNEAFVNDPLRDVLRGMLVALQALPYERLDVLFDGVLGHERIIAKRHTAFTPCESGVDVVHHIADTLLL
ncbi:hypothetical protein ACHHYP_04075 [Achlya hypogyna]|uniref:DUF676 domain-containing protein n=1 Tax=Achlya hypogyna TaxID=1202772 RepID=A0A1V9Z2C0_ACHHY|nr:hypothetical protein ACHHYP_04075 [Achlya hypogyna]